MSRSDPVHERELQLARDTSNCPWDRRHGCFSSQNSGAESPLSLDTRPLRSDTDIVRVFIHTSRLLLPHLINIEQPSILKVNLPPDEAHSSLGRHDSPSAGSCQTGKRDSLAHSEICEEIG